MTLGGAPDDTLLRELGQSPHWKHHIEVGLTKTMIDVHVIKLHIALGGAEEIRRQIAEATPA